MTKNTISGTTKICGIIGDPVEHTMSPAMQNAAFAEAGLDYIYIAFHVKPEDLKGAIEGMRSLNFAGFNVTLPHKINVIPLLDMIDPLAEKIGAVNTVVNENGKLIGYNTDASGFLKPMQENNIDPSGKKIVILGAGGAARAVSCILAENGAEITILNRASGMERAEKLAASMAATTSARTQALELNPANLEKALNESDILVNTTNVGMSPDINNSLVPPELLKPELVVYDIVYNPERTQLIRDAETAGAVTITGMDMLVWQGALAFEKWTGVTPPSETMKNEILRSLLTGN